MLIPNQLGGASHTYLSRHLSRRLLGVYGSVSCMMLSPCTIRFKGNGSNTIGSECRIAPQSLLVARRLGATSFASSLSRPSSWAIRARDCASPLPIRTFPLSFTPTFLFPPIVPSFGLSPHGRGFSASLSLIFFRERHVVSPPCPRRYRKQKRERRHIDLVRVPIASAQSRADQ